MTEHRTTVVEEGMYAYAVCSCGWSGKAECEPHRAALAAEQHISGQERVSG